MVRLEGLSQEEVAKKIQEGKQNKVTIKTEKSIGQIIRDNVFTYFNLIFLVLAFLLVAVKSWNNLLFVPIVVVTPWLELCRKSALDGSCVRCNFYT